jgi:dUTP pyrophosphatase
VRIEVTRLDPDLPLPAQQHDHDAGYDLCAREDVTLAAGGGRGLVPTGIAVAIPPGHAGLVLPRSGLALRHGVTCLNTPGLIDPQYRGELKVLLVNTDPSDDYDLHRGDRIAQLVILRVESDVEWSEVASLDATARDTFGFGSTGR